MHHHYQREICGIVVKIMIQIMLHYQLDETTAVCLHQFAYQLSWCKFQDWYAVPKFLPF